MRAVTSGIIEALRKNPNRVTIGEFMQSLDSNFQESKEEIFNMTFAEIFGINQAISEDEIVAALINNKHLIKRLKVQEISELLGCSKDKLIKVITYLKQETSEKIKIIQDGKKKGAVYSVEERM